MAFDHVVDDLYDMDPTWTEGCTAYCRATGRAYILRNGKFDEQTAVVYGDAGATPGRTLDASELGTKGASSYMEVGNLFDDAEGNPADVAEASADGTSAHAARRDHVHAGIVFDDAEGDPAAIGTAADGTSVHAARRDHVHAGDHGALGGLGDDDHTQYALKSGSLTQIATRSHTDLSDKGTNTHAQIDTHIGQTDNPHQVSIAQAEAKDSITPAADGTYANPTSITIVKGIITAIS